MPAKAKSKKVASTPAPDGNAINDARKAAPKPQWPAFAPLAPPSDLALSSLSPGQIVTISNFWTASLCKKYVSFLASLPLVTTPGTPKRGDAVRVNDRFQVDDPAFARRLWEDTALSQLVLSGHVDGQALTAEQKTELWGGEVLGLNPNIRIYRYSKGQFFDQHYDDSNNLMCPSADAATPAISAKTTWTLLLYLTSAATGCKGGETVFYPNPPSRKSKEPHPEPVVATLETGLALLHRHGKDCMLHEGREVTDGEKWVIRSDLCVRR